MFVVQLQKRSGEGVKCASMYVMYVHILFCFVEATIIGEHFVQAAGEHLVQACLLCYPCPLKKLIIKKLTRLIQPDCLFCNLSRTIT